MDSNKIISEWRGECRHTNARGSMTVLGDCEICNKDVADTNRRLDYTTDPSAWTPELYREIEDKGLATPFFYYLIPQLKHCNVGSSTVNYAWKAIKSTPAQKSEALARAIKEVSQ